MKSSFRYILVVTFIAAVIVIVFLQFNSSQSINQLINGNEDLMNVLKLKMELQQVQENVTQLETETKSIVIRGQDLRDGRFEHQVKKVNQSFGTLDSFETDPVIGAGILQLKQQVNKKIDLNKEVLRTFAGDGKDAAETLINDQEEALLSDSIRNLSHRIDRQYQVSVIQLIRNADQNGRNAKTFGTILAVIAAVASLLAFGYISYKMGEQQRLIHQLNVSEQRARRSAEAKENFLANMSHEIRTPLNAILGFTGLLQRKQTADAEAERYTGLIHKAGENLLQIVNNILDISKIEAGMMPVEKAAFNIRETVATIEHLYRPRSDEKGLTLSVQVGEAVPEFIEGDEVRLTQILVNLISNAIKFTERGGITVTADVKQAAGNKLLLAFMVSDTGMGMDASERAAVFARFRQGDDSIIRRYGGSGLGLTIVKDLVQLLQGSIELTSEKGTGTVFTILLPFGLADGTNSTAGNTPVNTSESEWMHKRLLVVEDNEMNRLLLAQLLKGWQLPFDLAPDGREAIRLLRERHYDLVLMDIQMPEMDGYTTTAVIRNELKNPVPVVAMTADALTSQKEKCLQAGMNDYLSKPLDEAVLHRLLVQLLQSPHGATAAAHAPVTTPQDNELRYLRLDYLHAVSRGNKEYEKEIMEQFCEIVPEELERIQTAWEQGDTDRVRKTAHSMQTTLAALGLTADTEELLSALEKTEPADPSFEQVYRQLYGICQHALEEAAVYYTKHYS
ncbi:response regulator [Niabella beijingensis]|uniref:response regulator n=1 Tax=Niabella beijingensis TaxID=2872700 RepID=UPI001CBC4273|nr:response regulator [Niabella beijingensis]MBZ4191449.1 response regulator [Niabella beijingensis]